MLVPDASIGRWPLSSNVDCHVSMSERHTLKQLFYPSVKVKKKGKKKIIGTFWSFSLWLPAFSSFLSCTLFSLFLSCLLFVLFILFVNRHHHHLICKAIIFLLWFSTLPHHFPFFLLLLWLFFFPEKKIELFLAKPPSRSN